MKRSFRTTAEQNAYDLGLRDAQPDGKLLTLKEIRGMSTEEVAARMDEVNEAMARGPVEGENDE
jgi:hypothetical protein